MKTKLANQNLNSGAGGNLAILLVVALALAYAAWSYWSKDTNIERESRLVFVGNQYKAAIGRYYENSPGTLKQFPRRLEDLIADGRITPKGQYMAELFADPMGSNWGLIKDAEGGITGVHSLSDDEPVSDIDARPEEYKHSDTYAQWVFQYVPPRPLAQSNVPAPITESLRKDQDVPTPPQQGLEQVAENTPTVLQSEKLASRRLPPPVGHIDAAAIQLGSGVPGIPPLATETDRRRRICIVNATRYATTCVNQPEINASQDAIRDCVVEAQQRYEQCGGV